MNLRKKIVMIIAGTMMSVTLFSSTALAASYTIVPNDTLYIVGRLFNTTVTTLKSENNLTSDKIYPGQIIEVPATEYTVKSGDSLFLIAKNFGIEVTALRKANNKWDNMLLIGQKLIIPAGKVAAVAPVGTVIPYTTAEVDLLARLITAEARGESYNAMVAVGAVVVNRVQSPDWPNSISTVINHVTGGYYQFTPVKNGYINNPATSEAIKAAWAALYNSDPSNNAMFYFDDSSTNEWLWAKTVTARIDSMVFVK